MSFLLHLYPGDKYSLFMAEILLQATVATLAAWLLARIAFRHNAAARHNVWLFALIVVIFSPATTYIADSAGLCILTVSMPKTPSLTTVTANPDIAYPPINEDIDFKPLNTQTDARRLTDNEYAGKQPADTAGFSVQDVSKITPKAENSFTTADRLRIFAFLAIAIWSLGISYMLIRLVRRGFALRRLYATIRSPDEDDNLRPMFAEISRVLGINQVPRIMLWTEKRIHITPIIAGVFRPVIILSQELVDSLERDELRDVLLHECAHVLRRDTLIGLLQRIADVLFWPYPLVWFMNRNLSRAREEVCDNYVLRQTDGPRYAQTLFDLSRRIRPLSPGLAHVGLFQYNWPLEQRVAGLLDTRRTVMTRIRPFTMSVLAVLFVSVAVLAAGTKAQSPASKDKSDDSQPTVLRRTVNKSVKDFSEKIDLSTPESAWAAYQRANVNKNAKSVAELSYWRDSGLNTINAMEKFFKGKDIDVFLQAIQNSEIIEVAVYHDDFAEVISKLNFPEGVGRDPYSARSFGRINGLWKNLGEDRFSSLEAARSKFDQKKDGLWKNFLETKDIVTGKTKPFKGEIISPENYERAKSDTPDSDKLLLMGLVENFFLHNARDITARKSLEWGNVEKNPDGTRSIRYKFEAKIWDRDTMIGEQKFTFDKDNVIISFEHITPPQKKEAGNQTWTNWNNGQSIGSFFAVAGTAKETVAVGIDGLIATRNNSTRTGRPKPSPAIPTFARLFMPIINMLSCAKRVPS